MNAHDRSGLISWDDAPLPYQRLDLAGRILDVNAAWTDFTGYRPEEIVGTDYVDLIPQEHHDDFAEAFSRLLENGYVNKQDCHLRMKDGVVREVDIFARLYESGGRQLAHCILVDVTESREAVRLLRDSEHSFRNLFELAPNPIIVHDGERVVLANDAAARFLGVKGGRGDLEGLSIAGFVHPDDIPGVAERVRRMMTEDWTAPLIEERFIRADGTFVRGHVVASPIVVGGTRLIQVAAIDQSGADAAAEALAESESRYEALFHGSADPIVVHDGRHARLVNSAARSAFGLVADEDVSSYDIAQFIDPISREEVGERIAALFAGKTQELAPIEVRLTRLDGSTWEAEAKSSVVISRGERLMQTTFRDLTERNRTQNELERYRERLEVLLAQRTQSLMRAREELTAVTAVIGRTVELRDPYTAGHQRRVAALSAAIADRMGLSEADVDTIRTAAAMHDIGKISVPSEILSKPSRLSDLEYELVKTHVVAGYEIMASAEIETPIVDMIYQHHERLDGSGYPRGLGGDQIVTGARVLMVADVAEAMMSHRPYRPAVGVEPAREELAAGRGLRYDAAVVDACLELLDEGFDLDSEV